MTQEKAVNREHRAWYMYDFGNSAYAAIVLLAIYSAYFKDGVVGGAEGSRLWGVSVGIAMLVVAIISPILGTIADFSASKKRFLFLFSFSLIEQILLLQYGYLLTSAFVLLTKNLDRLFYLNLKKGTV